MSTRLSEVLARWTLHTAGDVEHGPLIDHIASDLDCTTVRTWPGSDEEGRLSDHAGVMCTLRPVKGQEGVPVGGQVISLPADS